MFGSIFWLIAGFVLKANPQWFNGAHTVGVVLLVFGGVWLAIELIFLIILLLDWATGP